MFSPSQVETTLSHTVHRDCDSVCVCDPHTRFLGICTSCLSHKSWSVCAFVSSYLLEWVSTSFGSHKPLVQLHMPVVSHVYHTSFLLETWFNACVCVGCVEGCQDATLVTISLGYMCWGFQVVVNVSLSQHPSHPMYLQKCHRCTTVHVDYT